MKLWPFFTALLMLASAWGVIGSLSYGDEIQAKKSFGVFPVTIADRWQGKELGLQEDVLDVLKLSDYMMRVYWPTSASVSEHGAETTPMRSPDASDARVQRGPLWLYVGYYESQRTGSTYHSPKNCLPGAGWQFVKSEHVSLPLGSHSGPIINRVLIQKGLEQQLILYWYQDRGRVIASEYWAKGYMIWDAMTRNRTDGSLVRISIPVVTSPEDAYQYGVDFILDLWPVLLQFMPDQSIETV